MTANASISQRTLIVNADDLGLCAGVNRGILEAHTKGIVTSSSLMVLGKAAAAGAEITRNTPTLSVGLHLDLWEWQHDGREWRPTYQRVNPDDPAAVEAEARRQLERFRELVGRNPTHIDSHQHAHEDEPVRSVAMRLARELDVPLRAVGGIHYCGAFYGQSGKGHPCPDMITVEALLAVLAELPAGVTELACHPGYVDELVSVYRDERQREVETLCDPRVREALGRLNIRLGSFAGMGCSSCVERESTPPTPGVKRLNWGCGRHPAPGWINSDRQAKANIELVCDIREGLTLAADSIDYATSIHALQEVPLADLTPVLRELRRVLKPGGVLRLCLPDLDKAIDAYRHGRADYFLVPDEDARSLGGKFITHVLWYSHSRIMFTKDFIEEMLYKAGFAKVHHCEFRQTASPWPEITELDNREHESLFVEAVK